MNLHTYICFLIVSIPDLCNLITFMYDAVHRFKQHNSWGRTKMERKDGIKTRVQVF